MLVIKLMPDVIQTCDPQNLTFQALFEKSDSVRLCEFHPNFDYDCAYSRKGA